MMGDKISELTAASSMNDSDLFAIVQPASGGTTKKIAKSDAFGTMASQDADSVNIDGGTIDGVTIGGNSSASAYFANLLSSGGNSSTITFTNVVYATLLNSAGFIRISGSDSITADTGSSQGDGALSLSFNIITTCANSGDAVTLPTPAAAGYVVVVCNVGANSADVFPATGGEIGTAGTNNAVAVAAKTCKVFIAGSTTTWCVV